MRISLESLINSLNMIRFIVLNIIGGQWRMQGVLLLMISMCLKIKWKVQEWGKR